MRTIGIFTSLLLFCWLSVEAQDRQNTPRITIQASRISIGETLKAITKQTRIDFSFNPQTIDTRQVISLNIKKFSLEEALAELSKQANLEYQIIEGLVVLKPSLKEQKPVYYSLNGYITEAASGESLIGATISIKETTLGTVSNGFGFFTLKLKPGQYTIVCSYIGYEPKEVSLNLQTNQQQNFKLQPAPIDLPDVVVGLSIKNRVDQKQPGSLELSPRDLQDMPEFAGESGLVKGLQSLPGIKMHSDGSAFLYTRGGSRDQNLIIIDDAPIYNPSHLFGFYSVVIPEFAKQIQVYKNNMPTNLGDRLSSIVSIRTKDGNLNQLKLSGSINPLLNSISIENPVSRERGSIFASLRRSNFEWLYERNTPNIDLNFWDLSFKWNHKFDKHNRLFFTAIASADNFVNSEPSSGNQAGVKWGNFAATLRWNHLFGSKLFLNTIIYTGNYEYRIFNTPDFWQSRLGTLSLKSDFTHYISPNVTTKFGLELQGYFIDPGSFALDSIASILPNIESDYTRKMALYYQSRINLSDKLELNAGIRLVNWANLGPATYYTFDSNYTVTDTVQVQDTTYNQYFRIDPRISLLFKPDQTSRISLNAGIYHQYLQQISNTVSPFTSMEIWAPAGPNIKPQSAIQFSLDYLKYFEKPRIEFSGALYYKSMANQIDYKDHANILLNPFFEGELRFGQMDAYGLELLLKKEYGPLSGWITYTYSRVFRETPGLNNNQRYPAFQDRPHDFSTFLNFQVTKRTSCSLYWTIFSGSAFTSPTGFYTFNNQTVPLYTDKHNDRLPTYNRLDLAIQYQLNKHNKGPYQHSLTFSLYNALGHKNISNVSFNKVPIEGAQPVLKNNLLLESDLSPTQVDFIRFFPSLTYKFQYL